MKRIVIEAVSQSEMRPPYDMQTSGGDWFINDDGELVIRVIGQDFSDAETFLFALHELIETKLCDVNGIDQAIVDAFDAENSAKCEEDDTEPGDLPDCPYHREHCAAMLIEHLMANFMGIDDYGVVR